MPRLFAFGCSFTKYHWPTWADILGQQFDEYQNWGQRGAGNQFIHNSLVECHLKNRINKNDVVCIMWSYISRMDTYQERRWITPGNIYYQQEYAEPVKHLFDTRGFYLRDLALMYSAQQMLREIGCESYMFSIIDILNCQEFEPKDGSPLIADILPAYQPLLDQIRPSVHAAVFDRDWFSRPLLTHRAMTRVRENYKEVAGKDWPDFDSVFGNQGLPKVDRKILKEIFNLNKWDWKRMIRWSARADLHPTPLEHFEYLSKVLPERSISFDTYSIIKHIDDAIRRDEKPDAELMKSIMPQQLSRW